MVAAAVFFTLAVRQGRSGMCALTVSRLYFGRTELYRHRIQSAADERLSVIDSDGFTEMYPPRSRFQLPLNLGTPSTRNNFFVHKSSVLVPAPSSLCTFHPSRLIHFFFVYLKRLLSTHPALCV